MNNQKTNNIKTNNATNNNTNSIASRANVFKRPILGKAMNKPPMTGAGKK